ncbi:hypothetical protein ACMATS_10115 [Streptoverticillium reticulum]|uniref:hypothetical protein n=1 Tax=Streptoverticillium reticulum TaxID=1433415 RepID=UPI0039BFCC1A
MRTSTTRWLSQAAMDPRTAVRLWKSGRTAPLQIGCRWELVRTDFTLGTAAVSRLKAGGAHIGPYLMGGAERVIWWLLPLGTGKRLAAVTGVAVHPRGAEIFAPPPGRYLGDRVWVLPDQAGERWNTLTSADDLRAALDAADHRRHNPSN